jgi:hypothetical protein
MCRPDNPLLKQALEKRDSAQRARRIAQAGLYLPADKARILQYAEEEEAEASALERRAMANLQGA